MKKSYRIRPNSPADYITRALPFVGIVALIIAAGLMNTWELGLF